MLELAIAEAYRPRPRLRPPTTTRGHPQSTASLRPATFATNYNAGYSISSSHSRVSSEPSRTLSVTSHSRSFIHFIAWRKRSSSVHSSSSSFKTAVPVNADAARKDSLFSQITATPSHHAAPSFREVEPIANISSPRHPDRALLSLPYSVPLPPQDELLFFDVALQECLEALQSTSVRPDHDLALRLLEHLSHIANLASCISTSWPEFFAMVLHAAKLLISVIPAVDVGARNAMARSLADVVRQWTGKNRRDTVEVAGIAGSVFDKGIQERKEVNERIGQEFARWMTACYPGIKERSGKTVRILTIGVSITALAALSCFLASDVEFEIHLYVLTSLDQELPAPPSYERLQISTYSISALGTASQDTDILLLEPPCIGPNGDFWCQNGALGTAVCAKTLSPHAMVVALSSVDNVASSAMKDRFAGETKRSIKDTHELVFADFVDVYVTDLGVLKAEDLERFAAEAEELELQILGL